MTWKDYEADLEPRLTDLHARVQRGAYRPQPSRRTYIPKADGTRRPLAIAALEDKIVQGATVMVLNAIYEGDFVGFSYGFRSGRGPHDALDALSVAIGTRKVNWILDADIRNFFGSVNQAWLIRFLEHRIGDKRIIRVIQEMVEGGYPRRRDRDRRRQGNGSGLGDFTAPGQYLPALRHGPLGQPLATAGMIPNRLASGLSRASRCGAARSRRAS